MANQETTGLVQRLKLNPTRGACIWVGSSKENAEIFFMTTPTAFVSDVIAVLVAAYMENRPVTIRHLGTSAEIVTIIIE